MINPSELRLAQTAVALAGCVPVLAGAAGVLLGPAMTGAALDPASDSHFRYLSGLLLGIGLAFWTCIPALPHQTHRFRLLSTIVVLGGLARLLALPLHGWPGPPMAVALVMELAVVPLLCLWQKRLAHLAKNQHLTASPTKPTLPSIAAALLATTLLASSQPVWANDPAPGPPDSLRIGPLGPIWTAAPAVDSSHHETSEYRLSNAFPGRIGRRGNVLVIKLDGGKFVWLTDIKEDGSQVEEYSLQDYWPDHNVYIVDVNFNEYSEHWLISARTANVTKLYAKPYRDPSNPAVFITVGIRYMDSTSAEVWEGQGDIWVRHYKCDNLDEGADFLRWDGPGRAKLAAPEPYPRTREFILTKTNGEWYTDACRDP